MCKQLFLFLVFYFPLLVNAQNLHIIKPDGSVKPLQQGEILPSQKLNLVDKSDVRGSYSMPIGTKGLIDTIYQRDLWPQIDSRFGWMGQDVMIQWFKAPSELILKSVGFGEAVSTEPTLAIQVEIKVVSVNWTEAELIAATTDSAKHLGYYEAPGNGYNDAEPLIDDFDGINTWSVWHVLDSSTAMTEPFGTDIWSNNGMGVAVAVDPFHASSNPDDPTFHWVDMSLLGYEPTILRNQIFGIAIINSDTTVDEYWVRTWSTNNGNPWGAFKYYANGRFTPGVDYGWWARLYAWDMAYVADFFYPPYSLLICNVSPIQTTLNQEPQTVTADVVDANGPSNISSVKLLWSADGMVNWDSTAMVNIMGDTYSGDIPGQSPGTIIDWYIKATNFDGNVETTYTVQYRIYQPSGAPNLVVFNGYTSESGYPQSFYFGHDDFVNFTTFPFWHDVWAFGPLTMELLNYYNNVIEITTSGPENINSDTIATWLAASADRNYMLAGDEWLGAQTGWVNTTYSAGTFQYDILGITADYNDVNWAASGDDQIASQVYPVAGTLLGDSLEWKRVQVGVNPDSMMYDPYYEIGQANWLDGVDVLGDVEVNLKGIGVTGDTFNIAIHRTLLAGNKIAFLAYDPLSLNSTASNYYWFGFSSTAPQVQVLKWFGADTLTAIKKDEQLPSQFFLSQNYPNPFNPVTKIEYSIAKTTKVELTIFDILGREVVKLVNETKKAGKHQVIFDASKYSSGLYFYRMAIHSDKLKSGDFIQTHKMLLMK